jgi:hypothetical protein
LPDFLFSVFFCFFFFLTITPVFGLPRFVVVIAALLIDSSSGKCAAGCHNSPIVVVVVVSRRLCVRETEEKQRDRETHTPVTDRRKCMFVLQMMTILSRLLCFEA